MHDDEDLMNERNVEKAY